MAVHAPSTVSTEGLHGQSRVALVRDAAFDLFNLEVETGGMAASRVHADIHARRGDVISVVDVNTSWSVVRRTPARAAAATTDDFLLYLVEAGGSWFRNGRGEQFLTASGTVVLGSQAAPYAAEAAPGHDWRFQAVPSSRSCRTARSRAKRSPAPASTKAWSAPAPWRSCRR